MKRSLLTAAFAVVALWATHNAAHAQPLEFLKTCNINGYETGYFFMPGRDVCMNAMTDETVGERAYGLYFGRTLLRERIDKSLEAVAMTSALSYARIESGDDFALAGDVAFYEGYAALGMGLALRINDRVQFSTSGAYGLEEGQILGRLGFNASLGDQPAELQTGRAVYEWGPPPGFEPRWHVYAEGGYFSGGAVDYANFQSPSPPDFDGTYRLEDGEDINFAASIGRDVSEDLAWRLSGRHFRFEQTAENRPFSFPAGHPLYTDYDMRFQLSRLDFDALYSLDKDRRFYVLGGVRGFWAEEDGGNGLYGGTLSIATGVGVRGGVGTELPLGDSGFAVVGNAAVSLLYANFDSNFGNEHSNFNSFWYDDFIYAVEADAGLAWRYSENIRLSAIYRVEHWSDIRRSLEPLTGEIGVYDLTIHGPSAGVLFSF